MGVWGVVRVVCACVGVGGVVLCRCVCVCDLLIFLHEGEREDWNTERWSRDQRYMQSYISNIALQKRDTRRDKRYC